MTDEEIAALIQQGDKEKFAELMERYEDKLLRYGRKFLSSPENIEDIVQDVFLSTYQNIQSFDTAQKFSPWIYRIAHNAFVNALRKHAHSPFYIDFDTLVSHPVYEDPREMEREQEEMQKMVEQGLEKIPEKYREVLILHYFEELEYKEIAEVLQIPIGTVGVRLRRAKEALKKIYDKRT